VGSYRHRGRKGEVFHILGLEAETPMELIGEKIISNKLEIDFAAKEGPKEGTKGRPQRKGRTGGEKAAERLVWQRRSDSFMSIASGKGYSDDMGVIPELIRAPVSGLKTPGNVDQADTRDLNREKGGLKPGSSVIQPELTVGKKEGCAGRDRDYFSQSSGIKGGSKEKSIAFTKDTRKSSPYPRRGKPLQEHCSALRNSTLEKHRVPFEKRNQGSWRGLGEGRE